MNLLKTKTAGFSLLEMIGVMAVMAIMAGALAPSVFQMMEAGYETAEAESMESIGDNFERYVLRSKTIPAESDWVEEVADFAGMVPTRLSHNDKNYARKIYYSPKFFTNKKKTFAGFAQDTGLDVEPYSPRILIVSSLEGEVTANLNNQNRFDAVWDQTSKAKIKESKSVLIQRVNLAPHFVRTVLSNSSTNQVGYSVEGGGEGSVSAGTGASDGQRTVYLIADSLLKLRGHPYPGQPVLRQQVVKADASFRYQEDTGVWSWHH